MDWRTWVALAVFLGALSIVIPWLYPKHEEARRGFWRWGWMPVLIFSVGITLVVCGIIGFVVSVSTGRAVSIF